jgi:hypothetical protein
MNLNKGVILIMISIMVSIFLCFMAQNPLSRRRTVALQCNTTARNVIDHVLLEDELVLIDKHSRQVKWSTSRHQNYPTTDVPIGQLWELDMLMCDKLRTRIIPEICKLFHVDFESLWLRDMFLVLYEENAQRKLGLHRDASDYSFVMHINPLHEFDGGGTYFSKSKETVVLTPGQCVIFSGKEEHSGVEITRGRRLIITGFVDHAKNPSALRRQYLMYNLRALVERKMFQSVGFHNKAARPV